MIAWQAGAVVIDGRAILIEGAPGTGKSSLALGLIDRGAQLLADDGLLLVAREGRLFVRPHPNTAGLIEVRNLGILPMAHAAEAPAALVLLLDPQAPRFIEAAEQVVRAGLSIPLVRLTPESPVLPLRAELALAHYGQG